jgi:hypothetical protein
VSEAVADNMQLSVYDFDSQDNVTLRLYLLLPANVPRNKLRRIMICPYDEEDWTFVLMELRSKFFSQLLDEAPNPKVEGIEEIEASYAGGPSLARRAIADNGGVAYFAPRGIGRSAWTSDPTERIHIRRRFMLLGQTLDGMRVWDVRRAVQALRTMDGLGRVPLGLNANREMGAIALYATLFEPEVDAIGLSDVPKSLRTGPDFLNVLRVLDIPQTLAMVAEKSYVVIHDDEPSKWEYPLAVAKKLKWKNQIAIRVRSHDNAPKGARNQ